MQALEYRFVDKSEWPAGPWQTEADKRQWTSAAGFPCLIVRGPTGALCGYVGLPPGHLFYQHDYENVDVEDQPHGGLTYADFCQPDGERGICHVVEEGEDDKVWWLGFDCAHAFDLCPAYAKPDDGLWSRIHRNDIYRDFAYVAEECERFAAVMAGFSRSAAPPPSPTAPEPEASP